MAYAKNVSLAVTDSEDLDAALSKVKVTTKMEEAEELFRIIDKKKNGKVSRNDLQLFKNFVSKLIDEADTHKSNEMDLSEFKVYYNKIFPQSGYASGGEAAPECSSSPAPDDALKKAEAQTPVSEPIKVTVCSLGGAERLRTDALQSWTALHIKEALGENCVEYKHGSELLLGEVPVKDCETLQSLGFAPGDNATFNVVGGQVMPVGKFKGVEDNATIEIEHTLIIAADGSATHDVEWKRSPNPRAVVDGPLNLGSGRVIMGAHGSGSDKFQGEASIMTLFINERVLNFEESLELDVVPQRSIFYKINPPGYREGLELLTGRFMSDTEALVLYKET